MSKTLKIYFQQMEIYTKFKDQGSKFQIIMGEPGSGKTTQIPVYLVHQILQENP